MAKTKAEFMQMFRTLSTLEKYRVLYDLSERDLNEEAESRFDEVKGEDREALVTDVESRMLYGSPS